MRRFLIIAGIMLLFAVPYLLAQTNIPQAQPTAIPMPTSGVNVGGFGDPLKDSKFKFTNLKVFKQKYIIEADGQEYDNHSCYLDDKSKIIIRTIDSKSFNDNKISKITLNSDGSILSELKDLNQSVGVLNTDFSKSSINTINIMVDVNPDIPFVIFKKINVDELVDVALNEKSIVSTDDNYFSTTDKLTIKSKTNKTLKDSHITIYLKEDEQDYQAVTNTENITWVQDLEGNYNEITIRIEFNEPKNKYNAYKIFNFIKRDRPDITLLQHISILVKDGKSENLITENPINVSPGQTIVIMTDKEKQKKETFAHYGITRIEIDPINYQVDRKNILNNTTIEITQPFTLDPITQKQCTIKFYTAGSSTSTEGGSTSNNSDFLAVTYPLMFNPGLFEVVLTKDISLYYYLTPSANYTNSILPSLGIVTLHGYFNLLHLNNEWHFTLAVGANSLKDSNIVVAPLVISAGLNVLEIGYSPFYFQFDGVNLFNVSHQFFIGADLAKLFNLIQS